MQKKYQSSIGSSALYALSQTSDGGYVWAGYLQNSSTSAEYAIVVKIDLSGNILWQKTCGVAEYATDIRQTTDGGYIVGGITPPSPNEIVQGWIAKLDPAGNLQWQKVLGSSQSVMTNAVIYERRRVCARRIGPRRRPRREVQLERRCDVADRVRLPKLIGQRVQHRADLGRRLHGRRLRQ